MEETKFYITLESVDAAGDAQKCDIQYNGPDAKEVFERCKDLYHVEGSHGWDFLMDLHSEELQYEVDPVSFKREHFKTITGQEPKTHDFYTQFDIEYWKGMGTALDHDLGWSGQE